MTKMFKISNFHPRQSGQVMITSVIFLVLLSGVILGGIIGPAVSGLKDANDTLAGLQSYLVAESGTEDVLYRLKNNRAVLSPEILTLAGASATTEVTNVSDGKELLTTADRGNYIRKVRTNVIAGTGANFNYGVQAGNGGFEMAPQASVEGNVYSNGNIVGGKVTGTAIAANSIPTVTDQANDTPATPPENINFGEVSVNEYLAQSFTVSASAPVNQISLYVKKIGSQALANASVMIKADNAGVPGTTLASGDLSADAVHSNFDWIPVTFDTNPALVADAPYWLVFTESSSSSGRYYVVGANNTYADGEAQISSNGSTWNDTTPTGLDIYFKIYLGGLTASIAGVNVGSAPGDTPDEAWAHKVLNSVITGDLYCFDDDGSNNDAQGNDKACNTSRPDPTPQAMPISEANIADFKAEAEELGDTYNGDYTASTTVIGPLKITGDLIIDNSCANDPLTGVCLSLTGTVWVQGNLRVTANNKVVILDSSYGSNGGVIVVDGYISLGNGADFCGTAGYDATNHVCYPPSDSYIMLLTTSSCDGITCGGNYAIDVPNNAGTVILNAQRGTLHFKNNSGASAATANKIVMDNGAVVRYENGLADVNFSSGPSGGWQLNSWQEVE